MASMTMTASFLPGSTVATKQALATPRRGLVVAKAARGNESETVNMEMKKEEGSNGRRDVVFVAAAAAALLVAKVATAADQPKPGTLEAKKKYVPICVTMPTARICHK